MKRPIPEGFDDPPALVASEAATLDISVTTVLYGGGVRPGITDEYHPFREPSIRGHLRFWWRATVGAQFNTADQLREHEGKIWGNTESASKIRLRVLSSSRGVEGTLQPAYALFPAQPTGDGRPAGRVYKAGRVQIEFDYDPKVQKDLNSAMWAWLNFGGVGARTRRGLGALYSQIWAPKPADVANWLLKCSKAFCSGGGTRTWPTLRGARLVLGREATHQECWTTCIDMIRTFRQDRNGPRGRSHWPEPDQIRRERSQHLPTHAPVHPDPWFPRAAFGLPIVFHFMHRGDAPNRDPLDNTLQLTATLDRMASPLILKPIAVSATRSRPLLLILNTNALERLPDLVLLQKNRPEKPVFLGPRDVLSELITKAAHDWGTSVFRL